MPHRSETLLKSETIKMEDIPKMTRSDLLFKSNPKTMPLIATNSSIHITTKEKAKSKELKMMVSSLRNK
jgi:hypothetical protein